jgi:putative ABC transport system permease protein
MKFANFIFRNTLRNKRRTVLTILSISMSLFLISTLRTLLDTLENPPLTPDSAKRVVIRHATGLANTMPIKYREEISRIPGVDSVSSSQWFGGVYKDPANFFAQFAVDADRFFDVYSDVHTQIPEQKSNFIKDRTGALAGVTLAKRYGWKVGDRITLEGAIFPVNPEMTIDGLVSGGASESNFYFHLDYLNELFRPNGGAWNQVGTFIVKAKNAEDLPAISENIDVMYESSTAPTKTESEAAFILGFVSMLGNVRLLVMSISTVVLFTVILVAANTMAMSIRERTGEIAILKTLGFAPGLILYMMVAESMMIALGGGLLGSLGARYLYRSLNLDSLSRGFVQQLDVRWNTVLLSAGIALAVAMFSTLLPAYNASRLPISVAVRRRGE